MVFPQILRGILNAVIEEVVYSNVDFHKFNTVFQMNVDVMQ